MPLFYGILQNSEAPLIKNIDRGTLMLFSLIFHKTDQFTTPPILCNISFHACIFGRFNAYDIFIYNMFYFHIKIDFLPHKIMHLITRKHLARLLGFEMSKQLWNSAEDGLAFSLLGTRLSSAFSLFPFSFCKRVFYSFFIFCSNFYFL